MFVPYVLLEIFGVALVVGLWSLWCTVKGDLSGEMQRQIGETFEGGELQRLGRLGLLGQSPAITG